MIFTGGFEPKRVAFRAGSAVQSAIAAIGRTEDLHFSPDGKRLAIAGFKQQSLLVLEVEISAFPAMTVTADSGLLVSSQALSFPHGLHWFGNDALVVANREGGVGLFKLPERRAGVGAIVLSPVAGITKREFSALASPGSVSLFPRSAAEVEVLICHNSGHIVSQHVLKSGDPPVFASHRALLKSGLNIPDGITHDPSGQFVAVSNHSGRSVDIFDLHRKRERRAGPIAVLSGFAYPHGLRFSDDGQLLLVADAAEPFVHVFQRSPDGWETTQTPAASLRVMPEEAFLRGHANPEEGGPKGLALLKGAGLMAVTCEEEPIGFFDLRSVLAMRDFPVSMQRQRAGDDPMRPLPALREPKLRFWQRWARAFG